MSLWMAFLRGGCFVMKVGVLVFKIRCFILNTNAWLKTDTFLCLWFWCWPWLLEEGWSEIAMGKVTELDRFCDKMKVNIDASVIHSVVNLIFCSLLGAVYVWRNSPSPFHQQRISQMLKKTLGIQILNIWEWAQLDKSKAQWQAPSWGQPFCSLLFWILPTGCWVHLQLKKQVRDMAYLDFLLRTLNWKKCS